VQGLDIHIGNSVPSLHVDPARLGRALGRLVDNAARFSPQGSPVVLKIRKQTRKLDEENVEVAVISVLDRGPGVAPDDRERIFSPFEQGGDPLSGKPSGIGIGLHEARVIVGQHGGLLEYHPRKGGGSEFRVSIPLTSTEEKVHA